MVYPDGTNEELLVNGMDTDCDEDIENSPSSIDPYAEKVNDLLTIFIVKTFSSCRSIWIMQ